jgi:hypothetical protein
MLKIVIIITLLYFLFRNRIDIYLIFFLSNVLYGSHIIYGQVWVPPYTRIVQINAEIILSIVFIGMIIFTIIVDNIDRKQQYGALKNNKIPYIPKIWIQITLLVTWTLFIIIILYAIMAGSIGKKTLKSLSYAYFFFQYLSGVSFIFTWTLDRKINKALGTLPIVFLLFTGARAYAVLSFLSVIFIRLYNKKIFSREALKKGIFVVVIPLAAVLSRYWSQLMMIKSSNQLSYLFIIFGSYEWGQTSWNLNAATDASYTSSHSYFSVIFGSLPILHRFIDFGEKSFSHIVNVELNPGGFGYGLAGTLWGESYVLGGFIGVFIHLIILLLIIRSFNKNLIYNNSPIYPIYAIALLFLSFYSPRNDIANLIATLFNLIIFSTFYFLVYQFIPKQRKLIKN